MTFFEGRADGGRVDMEGARAEFIRGLCVGGARSVDACDGGGRRVADGFNLCGTGRGGGGILDGMLDTLRPPFMSGGGRMSFRSSCGFCLGVVSGEGSGVPSSASWSTRCPLESFLADSGVKFTGSESSAFESRPSSMTWRTGICFLVR